MNTATSLNDIADTFDMFASDQLAMISRYRTKRERDDAKTRADVWQDAARTLRETRIVDPANAELIRQLKWFDPAFPGRYRAEDWAAFVAKMEAVLT